MQQQAAAAPHPEGARRAVDERYYRKINIFNGTGWKDFSFQFKAATRSSHEVAFDLLCWAELEQSDIDPQSYTELHVESTQRVSGELFNVLTTSLEGEPLQMLYDCNFNGLEAWQRLSKRYSPTTPLRAMQLMLQIISPEKTKDLKHVQSHIDRWGVQDLGARERLRREIVREDEGSDPHFDPAELRDAILQNPHKFEKYEPTKERVIAMVEAKLSVRSPDEMEVDCVYPSCYHENDEEEIQAVGKGGVHCYRCGGQGHIAAKCGTPEPPKWKGKGGSKGDGKGKSIGKGKGKVEWRGFCSYCGKRGHGPGDCWTKQRDESVGEGGKGARLASLEDENDSGRRHQRDQRIRHRGAGQR